MSALNHGGFAALGTRYQKEVMGVKDDRPEYLFADMLRSGHNLNDPILCKVVSEKTGEVGDWLIDDLKSHTVQPGCSFLITQNTVKLALKETPQLGKKACLSF